MIRRIIPLFVTTVSCATVFAADSRPDVALSRIDCGQGKHLPTELWDDTVFDGGKRDNVNPCYLIRHGSEFMLWDTGMSVGLNMYDGVLTGPKRSVKAVLVEHGIQPEQIKVIGISHNHFDHLGQAADF